MIIRDANINDSLDIYSWRNDPLSLQMFKKSSIVTLEEHKKWFEYVLADQFRKIYIGLIDGLKVGMCRFDLDEKMVSAEVSINLNPAMRGRNISKNFLANCIKKYREVDKLKLTATIRKENKASLKIFKRCGFIQVNHDDDFYYHLAD